MGNELRSKKSILLQLLVTTSKALVTTSDAPVTNSVLATNEVTSFSLSAPASIPCLYLQFQSKCGRPPVRVHTPKMAFANDVL